MTIDETKIKNKKYNPALFTLTKTTSQGNVRMFQYYLSRKTCMFIIDSGKTFCSIIKF
jgi:hypothetical protein